MSNKYKANNIYGGCLEKKELGWYSAATEVDAATAFKKSLSLP